jgi:hypothetical protein
MTEWQPMDTAPKDGSWVLLSSDTDESSYYFTPFLEGPPLHVVTAHWRFGSWEHHYNDGIGHSINSPTGWMPLPERTGGEQGMSEKLSEKS